MTDNYDDHKPQTVGVEMPNLTVSEIVKNILFHGLHGYGGYSADDREIEKEAERQLNELIREARIEELQAVHDHWRKTYQSEKVQSRVEMRLEDLKETGVKDE